MERIVVGTDFSSSSEEAVRLAGEWARNYGAELTLLHVLGVPELAHFELEQPIREHRVLEEAAHEALDAMVDRILVGTRVRTAIVRGRGQIGASAADGIVDFAEEIDADLIVVSTHGRSGLSRLLLGSVAERVCRSAGRPVLTVPVGATSRPRLAGRTARRRSKPPPAIQP